MFLSNSLLSNTLCPQLLALSKLDDDRALAFWVVESRVSDVSLAFRDFEIAGVNGASIFGAAGVEHEDDGATVAVTVAGAVSVVVESFVDAGGVEDNEAEAVRQHFVGNA